VSLIGLWLPRQATTTLIYAPSPVPLFLSKMPKITTLPRCSERTRKSKDIEKSDLSGEQKYTSRRLWGGKLSESQLPN
jgi:hypothetical protein